MSDSNRRILSSLLIPGLQCVILVVLVAFWDFRLVALWQWGLVLLAAGTYLGSILEQLRRIKRFPKHNKAGLNHKRVHPTYVFLVFSYAPIVAVLPVLWLSGLISQIGSVTFTLTLESLFACWLFLDSEWSLRLAIGSRLFRMWFFPTLAFGIFAACFTALSANPDWFRYCLLLVAFASVARCGVSAYFQGTPVETAVPYFIAGKP